MTHIAATLEQLQRQDPESLLVEDSDVIDALFKRFGTTFKMEINGVHYLANHYDDLGSWTCNTAAYHFTRLDGLKEVSLSDL